MPRRTSLAERIEKDEKVKGVDAFFESPAPARPEPKEKAKSTKKSSGKSSKKSPRDEGQEDLIGVYFHIRDDQDSLLDRMKFVLRERDGRKVDRSELVREAIDLLATHYKIPRKIG